MCECSTVLRPAEVEATDRGRPRDKVDLWETVEAAESGRGCCCCCCCLAVRDSGGDVEDDIFLGVDGDFVEPVDKDFFLIFFVVVVGVSSVVVVVSGGGVVVVPAVIMDISSTCSSMIGT